MTSERQSDDHWWEKLPPAELRGTRAVNKFEFHKLYMHLPLAMRAHPGVKMLYIEAVGQHPPMNPEVNT